MTRGKSHHVIEREMVIREIQHALSTPTEANPFYGEGELRGWFIQHLDGIAPMMFAEKGDGYKYVRLIYEEGWTEYRVAKVYGVHHYTVNYNVNKVFNDIVQLMPRKMFNGLLYGAEKRREREDEWRRQAARIVGAK